MLDPIQLALLLAVALAPPVILAIRLRNAERHRREPWRALWRAFAWGATLAAALAIVVEAALGELPVSDAQLWLPRVTVGVVVFAPVVEELAKALGLRLIRDRDPEPEDGYIYGGAVGLGFAATENTIYILSAFLVGGEQVAFATALYRGVATVALHGAASAVAGHALWRVRRGRARLWVAWGLGGAILLHAGYNALAGLALGWATLLAAGVAVVAYMRMMRRVAVLDARPRRSA